jgi:hypothetical protein
MRAAKEDYREVPKSRPEARVSKLEVSKLGAPQGSPLSGTAGKPDKYSPGFDLKVKARRSGDLHRQPQTYLSMRKSSLAQSRGTIKEARVEVPLGNRVVSLKMLSRFVHTPCECGGRLRLLRKDKRMGLASRLIFECDCGEEYGFETSEDVATKPGRAGVKGKAINFQTIVGALASGRQLKGVQAQFASMDVPVMGPDAFIDAMGKITVACENLAKKAFKAARQEETRRVLQTCKPVQTIDSEGIVHYWYPLKGSFDGAWCKRGMRQMG